MTVAKLFTHGGSQAVRLPKEFRFAGTAVHVRRVGDDVILSPRAPTGMQGLIDALTVFEPGLKLQRERASADERAAIAPRR